MTPNLASSAFTLDLSEPGGWIEIDGPCGLYRGTWTLETDELSVGDLVSGGPPCAEADAAVMGILNRSLSAQVLHVTLDGEARALTLQTSARNLVLAFGPGEADPPDVDCRAGTVAFGDACIGPQDLPTTTAPPPPSGPTTVIETVPSPSKPAP